MNTLMTQNDIVEYLQISRQSIHAWRKKGIFPAPMQIGKILRWKPEEVKEFADKNKLKF